MTLSTRPRVVAVVGAGPVGCLAALAMAKMGCKVDIYEGRPDMRLPSSKASQQRRSVNLAISSRGIAALEFVDSAVAKRCLQTAIPMRGRVIHDETGAHMQLYDPDGGRCINSVDRGLLNEHLLTEVTGHELISVHFQHKLVTADFDKKTLVFDSGTERIEATFDLCIGADGSYSNVRRQMMRVLSMDYQQQYIPHAYVELHMPPGEGSTPLHPKFALDPNGLHIWPRDSFMLIALPNKDGSFTCTLFGPLDELARLHDRPSIVQWFQKYFQDALGLIGEENLVHDLTNNPRSSLISIKTNPYHYKDCAIILGDAAHSMVPFYGQGLNCGLEDVRVLASTMLSLGVNPSVPTNADGSHMDKIMTEALEEYSRSRHQDLLAICDLAMNNYIEMRHSVTTVSYIARRAVDRILARLFPYQARQDVLTTTREHIKGPLARDFPGGWVPLYTMGARTPADICKVHDGECPIWVGNRVNPKFGCLISVEIKPAIGGGFLDAVTFRPDIPYAFAKAKAELQDTIITGVGWTAAVGGLLGSVAWYMHYARRGQGLGW